MKVILVALIGALIGGCASIDKAQGFLKQIQSGAYDAAAKSVSEYCERVTSDSAQLTRTIARREIRQRGSSGPFGEDAYQGPVVRIWCEGEEVPVAVWTDLEK